MLIVWDSMTGNVKRFVEKLGMRNVKIEDGLIIEEPFILVTYTTGKGLAPKKVLKFIENNHKYLKGVASSGNRNWGNFYAKAGEVIANEYSVPLIAKFELSGTTVDIEHITERIENI